MKLRKIYASLLLAAALLQLQLFPAYADAEDTALFGSDEEYTAVLSEVLDDYEPIDMGCIMYCAEADETYCLNADRWYSHASLYKIPMVMKVSNLQYNGEAQRFDKLKYDLETVKHDILVYSNASFSSLISSNFTVQELNDNIAQLSGLELSSSELKYIAGGNYSPRLCLGILQELYLNSEIYPHVLDYMKEAQPKQYLRHFMEEEYEIAQKYGSAKGVNHIAGIVFADQPIFIVIMTDGMSISLAEELIGKLGKRMVEYANEICERKRTADEEERLNVIETPEPVETAALAAPIEPIQTAAPVIEELSPVSNETTVIIISLTAAILLSASLLIYKKKR